MAEPGGCYDLVVVSAVADITRWARTPARTAVVYDLLDSYLALPRIAPRSLLRAPAKLLSGELRFPVLDYTSAIRRMCERAEVVVCTTEEQRHDIRPFCDEVHIVLDLHDEIEGQPKQDYALRSREVHLVWEGLPQTLGPLLALAPTLRGLDQSWEVHLHLVTDREYHQFLGRYGRRSAEDLALRIHPRAVVHPWSAASLVEVATAADIAVIPLDLEDPFSRGKPENKLLILWRLGLPTVTSASPAYVRAMAGAGLDLVCRTPSDWRDALDGLLASEDRRAEAGRRGRAYVAAHHREEQVLARWDAVIDAALSRV